MKYSPNYNDPKILRNYALWYYEKYFPSTNKLKKKLLIKNSNEDVVGLILKDISNIFKEEEVIKSIIFFQKEKKSKQAIITNLINNFFDKNLIEKVMSETEFFEENLISIEFEKFKKLNIPKEKIIQKLLRKGFKYADIKRILDQD